MDDQQQQSHIDLSFLKREDTSASHQQSGAWTVAFVVNDFLVNVNATFTALQVTSAVAVSKQYTSLRSLCIALETASSSEHDADRSMEEPLLSTEEKVSNGASCFIVSRAGINMLMRGIDVVVADLYREVLDDQGQNNVVSASAVLYLSALHGLTVLIAGRHQAAGRESSPVLPCLPLEFINTSNVDFVTLVGSYKHAFHSCFGDAFLQQVCQQHTDQVVCVACGSRSTTVITIVACKGAYSHGV